MGEVGGEARRRAGGSAVVWPSAVVGGRGGVVRRRQALGEFAGEDAHGLAERESRLLSFLFLSTNKTASGSIIWTRPLIGAAAVAPQPFDASRVGRWIQPKKRLVAALPSSSRRAAPPVASCWSTTPPPPLQVRRARRRRASVGSFAEKNGCSKKVAGGSNKSIRLQQKRLAVVVADYRSTCRVATN